MRKNSAKSQFRKEFSNTAINQGLNKAILLFYNLNLLTNNK